MAAPPPNRAAAGAARRIALLDPARDAEAAEIAAAAARGTPKAGRSAVADARRDAETTLYGVSVGEALVAVYALRIAGLSAELALLAVGPPQRRQGHGRACLADAFARIGGRPLVVETDADALGFFRAAGFKLVGKRHPPGGSPRYRLGWHAPRPPLPDRRPLHLLPPPLHGNGAVANQGSSGQRAGVKASSDGDGTAASPGAPTPVPSG